jgi:hypothetical protein
MKRKAQRCQAQGCSTLTFFPLCMKHDLARLMHEALERKRQAAQPPRRRIQAA